MKANQIVIGHVYLARVGNRIAPVRVLGESESYVGGMGRGHGRYVPAWRCLNELTGREILVRSCQRFREEVVREVRREEPEKLSSV